MKQLKKTILTLALLIAATTQAWATDYLYLDISSDGESATIYYGDPEGKPYLDPIYAWTTNGSDYWDLERREIRSLITTVTFDESCQTFNGKSLQGLFFYFHNLITINGLYNLCTDKVEYMNGVFAECHALAKLDLSSFNTANVTDMQNMFNSCENLTTVDLSSFNTANVENMVNMFNSCENLTTVDLSSFNTANVTDMANMFSDCYKLETIYVSDDWSTANVQYSTYMFDGCKKLPGYKDSGPEYLDQRKATLTTDGGYLTYKAPGTPVATPATDATNTSLSLTQPTGNVTIRVKYYDQAEFADGLAPAAITGVQASTADPIITPGTVKTIGTSDVKMGTVKYHASQTALTDADLLALGTDDWSSDVPKATNLSTGDAYVYYYIQGAEPASGNAADRSDANTCSDSDIKRLTVNLIAPPTYDVSLNKTGLADGEPAKWKAKSETVTTEVNLGTNDLEGVTKGETVTVTYTGSRKVIGVKAEKMGPTYKKWDKVQKKLVATEIPATATKVENANAGVTWSAGTYVVEGDVTINGTITLNGNVDLIIKDGAKLTVNSYIYGGFSKYNLSIYGQANQTGQLVVNCTHIDAIYDITTLEVHSCQVKSTSSAVNCGGFYQISTFNVYGGSVDSESTDTYGDGIWLAPNNSSMNIYGGEVKAVGKGNNDNGIYGIMTNSQSSPVTVYGGKLWAECAGKKALQPNVTLTKGEGFDGKIETSADGTSWTEYSGTGTPDAKYVRVGYSSAGAD